MRGEKTWNHKHHTPKQRKTKGNETPNNVPNKKRTHSNKKQTTGKNGNNKQQTQIQQNKIFAWNNTTNLTADKLNSS